MSEHEYDHKKSEKVVGQLYPVLLDKHGRVIDGFHRLESDPNWRTEKHPEIDTEEKLLIARCVANWHRRQVTREEKEEWINRLAEIYKKQGLKVKGDSVTIEYKGKPYTTSNQILAKIVEVTGLHPDTVRRYLFDEFKQVEQAREIQPRITAKERIEHELGKDYVERHREEVKKELLENPEFVMEVVEKAPQILSELPKKVVDEEGRHIPTVTKEQMQKAKEAMEKAKKEIEEKRKQPATKRRGELVKNWMAHGEVVGLAESLKCPICGAGAENLVWKCHNISVSEAHKLLKEKLEG